MIITDALNILNDMNLNLDLSELTVEDNGRARALNIFYAGNTIQGLLNHGGIYNAGGTLNGVGFRRYQISNMSTNEDLSVRLGLVIHENGHSLMNWRDLYDHDDLDMLARGIGLWCIMGGSTNPPQQPVAYLRYLAGWIDIIDITDAVPGTQLSHEANGHSAFVYWRNTQEAYFIEARRNVGIRNQRLPGSGLAIWHIHTEGRNNVAENPFPSVALMQADGRNDLENRVNSGDGTDLFRAGLRTKFNSTTLPAAIYHDRTPSPFSISGISDSGAVMTFIIGDNGSDDEMSPKYRFLNQVMFYALATNDVEAIAEESFTLGLVSIPEPRTPGITLTVRSDENLITPATITRDVSGNLFTVPSGRTLILENIIIDGGSTGTFAETGGGPLVRINAGGAVTMNNGAVVRNNINPSWGGGVYITNEGTFTMNGGEISGNVTNVGGGGVHVTSGGTFTMAGGEISGNTAGTVGGGVDVRGRRNMSNSKINGNTADAAGGVNVAGGTFTMNGGEINDNAAGTNGGGVHKSSGELVLGGTAVISGNTVASGNVNNVNLPNNQYADISSTTPPAAGMNVGITKTTNHGVFVQNGATAEQTQYFHDDAAARIVSFYDGMLVIGSHFYHRVAAYATAESDVIIEIEENIVLDRLVSIPIPATSGITLTIRSANPNVSVTLTRGINGNLFAIPNGGTLILENVILDGDSDGEFEDGGGTLVRINAGGAVTMNNGAVVRNNINPSWGGGVYITNEGTFTMNGGEISGNVTNVGGGGVHITSGGTFTMAGGKISGNTAGTVGGGVDVRSGVAFVMRGGEISGNTALSGAGGGVYVFNGATFTMYDGEISHNTTVTNNAAGVRVDGEFTMNGGKINHNTALANFAGGVAILGGKFTLNNGEINGNTSTSGGGVLVWSNGEFIINGGEISGNTAPTGGGVRVASGSTAHLNGGVVTGTGANIAAIINGTYNLNTGDTPSPNNAVIIAWNKPAGDGPFNYTAGTPTDLTVSPSVGATAVWATQNGNLGISYANGENEGFISIATMNGEVTPIIPIIPNPENPKIGGIGVQTTYYNLRGQPLGTAKPTTPGIYIEKHGKNVRKVMVK